MQVRSLPRAPRARVAQLVEARRYAIKVPSLRRYGNGLAGLLWSVSRGILANQSEVEWWRNSPADQKTHMCPVLRSWFGGVVQVYPRCAPFKVPRARELAMFHRDWFPVAMDPQPGDNKPDNYGWLDGRVVVLDYDMNYNGCPHDRSGFVNRAEGLA